MNHAGLQQIYVRRGPAAARVRVCIEQLGVGHITRRRGRAGRVAVGCAAAAANDDITRRHRHFSNRQDFNAVDRVAGDCAARRHRHHVHVA